MNADKLMQTIKAIDVPRAYWTHPDEFIAISEANNGKIFGTACDVFCYGFLKGQRAAKAEARKKAQAQRARQTAGYGKLIALIEKNAGNERFIKIMAAMAGSLDGGAEAQTREVAG